MRVRTRSAMVLAVGLGAAALGCATVGPAFAAPTVTPISTKVGTPYNLAAYGSKIVVADGGGQAPGGPVSQIAQVQADGSLKTILKAPDPGEVAGIAFGPGGRSYAYTSSEYAGVPTGPEPPVLVNGSLTIVKPGVRTLSVNLATYEKNKNPDRKVSYGVKNAPACLVEALGESASYKGLVDSHPYSVDYYRGGSWVVADAAGNDLLRVGKNGHVSTLAVLPRQPLKITAAIAKSEGIPATCAVVGKTYYFEAVPTDVEYDGGYFWVSTLSGGPETLARGKVYRVNRGGQVKEVASGLSGATNLARHDGKIYVAELFGGRISVIKDGRPTTYVDLPGALSVEWSNGHLLAGTGVAGPSSVVRIG